MTGQDIKVLSDLYVGIEIPDDEAILIINEAINIIGDLANTIEQVAFVVEQAEEWCKLPAETTAVLSVSKDGKPFIDWQTRGMSICFNDIGDFKVTLRKMVPTINSINDEIKIHPAFYTAIGHYLRGFIKLMEHDDSPDGATQMELFRGEVAKASAIVNQIRNRIQ